MLDLLDKQPQLRLSDDHMKAILWTMKECGTPDIPTFSALRRIQAQLKNEMIVEPKHHVSSLGNHFYTNHPAKLLSLVSLGCSAQTI
jgi:hypothetical protein